MKQLIALIIILLISSTALFAVVPELTVINTNAPQVCPNDISIQQARVVHKIHRVEPRRDDFIGERTVVGDTWYDFQTNGSLGEMIAVDPDGGIHITWMDSYESGLANAERHQKYNYYNPDDEEWISEDGEQVDYEEKGGYGSLYLTTEDNPRALSFCHAKIDGIWGGIACIDFDPGWGVFTPTPLPEYQDQAIYFTQGVMSPEGRIHTASQRRDRGMISYVEGFINDDDVIEFGDFPIEVGGTHRTTLKIACSHQDERAAIAYLNPRAGIPQPENYNGYAYNNDLMLVWTDDGEDWNFDDPLNITDNIPPNPQLEGDPAYGDTLRPYGTFDIIFDPDNNIHIVFDARGVWVHPYDDEELPIEGVTGDASMLFHWDEESEEIVPVVDGWFTHREVDDEGNEIRWPIPANWKSNVCHPTLAYDQEGTLYCVYNYYPQDDYSNENYCNGDIAVTVSEDNGASWYLPTMITETRTHLADEGESECECYPTIAEVVDNFLHISYELDTEPGSTIGDYENRDEVETLCPWIYHQVPVDEIAREEIWEDGPNWHAEYLSVEQNENAAVPNSINIESIYPNPFNSTTSISYALPFESLVSLSIYSLDGRKVARLKNGISKAGKNVEIWNAMHFASGMYLIRLDAANQSITRKILLIK